MKLYSYGKINLFLDIKGKLPSGYHLIKTIMQSIDLHDEIYIDEISENKIIIECSDKNIPTDNKNTCFKAAELIKDIYKINTGVKITINKLIPSEAGLAGGSGNSAAVLAGLNRLWNLTLTKEEIQSIGLKIGADVPFCLTGGTYLAEGIGEKLTKLKDFIWDNILVIKPDFNMSTAFVYSELSKDKYNLYTENNIIAFIENRSFTDVASSIANTLESVVEKIHPEINTIKDVMNMNNAVAAMMTGSGSAIYGLFPDKESMDTAYKILKKTYIKSFKTKTVNKGIELLTKS